MTGLIKLYPGRCGQLMEPCTVHRYSHMGTQNTIWGTNFVCICLFYRLCQQHEKIEQERAKIRSHRYHKSQWFYKLQRTNHKLHKISLWGHYGVFLISRLPRFGFWWTMDVTSNNWFCIGNL